MQLKTFHKNKLIVIEKDRVRIKESNKESKERTSRGGNRERER